MTRIVKPLVNTYRFVALSRLAGRKLKALTDCCNLESLVDLAFSFEYKHPLLPPVTISPTQVKEEILVLLKIVKGVKPKYIMEIGTAGGGTLFLFSRISDPSSTIISIDLPSGPFGGGYHKWRIPLYQPFVRAGQKIHLIRADSHDLRTLETVKEILGEQRLDFLFIDGDHTYVGVKRDFEMYSSIVKGGHNSFS